MYWNARELKKLLNSHWLNSTSTIEFNHLRADSGKPRWRNLRPFLRSLYPPASPTT